MRLVWSEPAVEHLAEIRDYIAREAPDAAARWVQDLISAAEILQDFPKIGRTVPEGDGRHREILHNSYRLIYRMDRHQLVVVAVVHGSRDLLPLMKHGGLSGKRDG
jgi:addiction module RelE/StbE family toxin